MTNTKLTNRAQIEGLLFISGDEGVTLSDLAKISGFMKPAVLAILQELKKKYEDDLASVFILLENDQTYRSATKPQLTEVIKHYPKVPLTVPLTRALLEVLTAVAYQQPITRLEIDDIRGVQSSGSLQKLMVRGLVDTYGRLDAPGRPFLCSTTPTFLNYFGLSDLDELPPLSDQDELEMSNINGDIFLEVLQVREERKDDN